MVKLKIIKNMRKLNYMDIRLLHYIRQFDGLSVNYDWSTTNSNLDRWFNQSSIKLALLGYIKPMATSYIRLSDKGKELLFETAAVWVSNDNDLLEMANKFSDRKSISNEITT